MGACDGHALERPPAQSSDCPPCHARILRPGALEREGISSPNRHVLHMVPSWQVCIVKGEQRKSFDAALAHMSVLNTIAACNPPARSIRKGRENEPFKPEA